MSGRWPLFGDQAAGPPIRHYQRELDMGNDRELFGDLSEGLPVYEGRMVDQFDHRAKAYRSGRGRSRSLGVPSVRRSAQGHRSSVASSAREHPAKLGDRTRALPNRLVRRNTAPRNERSLVAALIPPGVICGNKVPTFDFPARV